MNKGDLIQLTSERANISKAEAKRVIDALTDSIGDTLAKGDKVSIKGFGTFQTKTRASRRIRNMHTAEMITVPSVEVPTFKPGKVIKDQVAMLIDGVSEDPTETKEDEMVDTPMEPETYSDSASKKPTKVIAVTSGKGGTGKTNFVINTAIAMAQKGLRVSVIDADLGTANVDILLGLHCKKTINSLIDDKRLSLLDIMVEGPEGINIIPGGSGLQTLAELPSEELGRIINMLNTLEDLSDVILVDTGSGISRNVVDFAVAADEIVVVVTPEPHAISDAYSIIKVLNSKEMRPPIKLVFNLVDNINEAKLVSSRLLDVTNRFLEYNPETIGHIVKDDNLVRSVKQFRPLVLYNPLAPASRCFITIADKLVPEPDGAIKPVEEKRGFFGKLKNLFAKAEV